VSANGWWIAGATLLSAMGMWLLLPRGNAGGRWFGGLLGVIGLTMFAAQLTSVGDWLSDSIFAVLAGVTVGAGVATVTFRNPVYCAVWFALCLLGSAGLFFFQGAQFLGVATVVVYAGAILVTLLFVLMLANPQGHASYDRRSWEAPLSATAGMVMVGILTLTVVGALRPQTPLLRDQIAAVLAEDRAEDGTPRIPPQALRTAQLAETPEGSRLELSLVGVDLDTIDQRRLRGLLADEVPQLAGNYELELRPADNVLHERHVSRMGGVLFSQHLIAVEAASLLLLAALVGATAIVVHSRLAAQATEQTSTADGRGGNP